jgi:uncharacterized protein YyaL (SSP411 family)
MLNTIQSQMPSYGAGYSHWGNLMLRNVYPLYEIAVAGKNAVEKRAELEKYYIPNKIVLGTEKESNVPLLEGKYVKGQTLFYVCVNKACQLPTTDLSEALGQVK